jgi:hypothetical protein
VPGSARPARLSPWATLVAACAVVVGTVVLVVLVASLTDRHTRVASYDVRGTLGGMVLDLGDADLVVERGRGSGIEVEHVDHYGFGHGARVRRTVVDGIFHVRSRCPSTVLHSCSVRYRVAVPDNVPLTVTTTTGAVRFRGYRGSARITSGSGDVTVRDFCGFALRVDAERGGDVSVAVTCPLQQLSLRTTSGSIRARVPSGRYRVDASSSGARPVIRGIAAVADAPFSIQALSGSGRILVERGA